MKPETIKKEYSKLAKEYGRIVKWAKYTAHLKIARMIIGKISNKKAKVLDLGCGSGISSALFFKKGYQVTGIDIAPGMIKQAKKLPFQKLICQNIEKPLKVPKNHFDAAILTSVMEFIQNPLQLFKRINKVLKDGGYFALTVPKKLTKKQQESLRKTKWTIESYHKKEIEPMFKKAGFKIEKKTEFFGWYTKDRRKIQYYGYLLKKK
ncbi:methyltransferase domain-containing protein [Candidatus Woesearchaeota archaeon]|nr:methyltransferase domain-containing protein [Candidatus Woesearchaeota archaeon]